MLVLLLSFFLDMYKHTLYWILANVFQHIHNRVLQPLLLWVPIQLLVYVCVCKDCLPAGEFQEWVISVDSNGLRYKKKVLAWEIFATNINCSQAGEFELDYGSQNFQHAKMPILRYELKSYSHVNIPTIHFPWPDQHPSYLLSLALVVPVWQSQSTQTTVPESRILLSVNSWWIL